MNSMNFEIQLGVPGGIINLSLPSGQNRQ